MQTIIKFLASDLIYLIVLVLPFLFWQKKRLVALRGGLAGVFAWGVTEFIKNAVFSPRPYQLGAKLLLVSEPTGSSFPSGHTAVAAALAAAVFTKEKKLGVTLTLLAVLVGVGRVAAGAHFAVDVVAGFFLGTLVGLLTPILLRAIPKKNAS